MTEQLDFLIKYLIDERDETIDIPDDYQSKRALLRSLMNVRPPLKISDDFLKVQDELLTSETSNKDLTSPEDIREVNGKLMLWQGDNAANSKLLGCFIPQHNCIDNVIHSAAGVQLRAECNRIMQTQDHDEEVGRAKITGAYNLPSKHVIHTVGPIVTTSRPLRQQEVQLASCYSSCLDLADRHGLESIAFCCISTGEFRFPNDRACDIAVSTVRSWMASHPESSVKTVIFNTFKDIDHELYQNALAKD